LGWIVSKIQGADPGLGVARHRCASRRAAGSRVALAVCRSGAIGHGLPDARRVILDAMAVVRLKSETQPFFQDSQPVLDPKPEGKLAERQASQSDDSFNAHDSR
jgi:hypothetical protein